jgi:carbamoyl-phosphate synthase large subunit
LKTIPGNKLLLDHYLDVKKQKPMRFATVKNVYHMETPCGVHSGDSNATLPPFNLGEFVMQQIKDHTKKNSTGLSTVGLINIQFAIKDDIVYY